MTAEHHHVLIVGTGFSGLGAAIRLRQEGIDDLVVLERADDVGGTWRDNSYPGCACDVPSNLYSFSFAQNPAWTRSFSPQPEIYAYLQRVAREHGVYERVRFGHEVLESAWHEEDARWHVSTSEGDFTADVVVSAAGALSEPALPQIDGLEDFAGRVFHSARWDHDFDPKGKRVAVVGTGASAIQFVPELQPDVAHLDLFQRTAPWVLPRNDKPTPKGRRVAYRFVPGLQRLVRRSLYWAREAFALPLLYPRLGLRAESIGRHHINKAIKDPVLREKVTPTFAIGCKRILLSNRYFPALAQDNVDVVTDGVARITPTGVVDGLGVEHPADAIIFGTGFQVTDQPIAKRVRGRDGRTLEEVWQGSPGAYLGSSIAGFPNAFILLGPNTGLGHNSVIVMIEAQIEQLVAALKHLSSSGATTIEPTVEAQEKFLRHVDELSRGTVWTGGGCASWYIDSTGRNSTLWPTFTVPFIRRMAEFKAGDYALDAQLAPPPDRAGERTAELV